jgi:hypothetical protein
VITGTCPRTRSPRVLDAWLAQVFDPDNIDETLDTLHTAIASTDDAGASKIDECASDCPFATTGSPSTGPPSMPAPTPLS